jgi:hypothetical protein
MKYSSSFTYLLLIVLGTTFLLIAWIAPSSNLNKTEGPAPANYDAKGIAVVELFTSQGCSSCPPADKLLSSISEKAAQQGLAIYTLSFHVDYWNRLGWEDPYSQPAFSQRQRDYASTWRNAQVYTPQMVVNGKKGFVGSSQPEAWQKIDKALTQSAAATVNLSAITTDQSVQVTYQLEGEFSGQYLQVALVEKEVETSVHRGENSGRKLQHSHVVRQFVSEKPDDSGQGTVNLLLPHNVLPQDAQLVAYLQDPSSLVISGGGSLELEPAVN